ncbi:MAG: hypothetical protein AUH25_06605 [Thaumarchaeota archaeon 13_1_40CM_38_12]|nr:MAG: hypothetical protein AUH25_06605 [Thaumarchaeota archaeon 13_1_40CM_38_12]OLC94141.1 MAG: hypothetical protein AUI92_01375 [Thaumarchaeota archaeon 13_1_40CM_3_38_6]OLD41212.1 MAG: hypothetical protein AUI60_02470 [Thaumarchaeota archaeon 13_1_40CM_2_39_4]
MKIIGFVYKKTKILAVIDIFQKLNEMFPGSDPQRIIGGISLILILFLYRGAHVARLGGPKIIFHHSSPSACIWGV